MNSRIGYRLKAYACPFVRLYSKRNKNIKEILNTYVFLVIKPFSISLNRNIFNSIAQGKIFREIKEYLQQAHYTIITSCLKFSFSMSRSCSTLCAINNVKQIHIMSSVNVNQSFNLYMYNNQQLTYAISMCHLKIIISEKTVIFA